MKTRTRILKTIWLVIRWPVGTVAVLVGLALCLALVLAILIAFGHMVLSVVDPSRHVGFWEQAAVGASSAGSAALVLIGGVNFGFFVREKWDEAGKDDGQP